MSMFFVHAIVHTLSFGEGRNVPFNLDSPRLKGTFHLSPNENICTVALITIHYL